MEGARQDTFDSDTSRFESGSRHTHHVRLRVRAGHLGRAEHHRPRRQLRLAEVEGIADNDDYRDPVQQWEPADASPSGMTAIGGTLLIANLRGEVLRAVPVADPSRSTDHYAGEYGRIRDVTRTPDGDVWFVTNNTDGRGDPGPDDDRILSVRPSR